MLDLTAMSRRRCRRGAVRRRESDEHAILARTEGIPITVVAASETEGTSEADNWQNTVVDGSSPIRTPADLVGKTLALNALKGVGEVTVKAALDKRGIDPNSVKYLAIPFRKNPGVLKRFRA